jgi:histidinol-phosphate aminotransferase
MGIESLARPEILAMKPYSSARKEAPGEGILLNANESPWPLIEQSGSLNRYPDPQPVQLLSRLATLYSVPEERVLVTRGSDEGIDLLTRVFCRAGQDAILQCPPNFGMYRIAAQTQGAEIISVNRTLEDGFRLDEQAVLEALVENEQIKLVFLTSPNNPTGDVIDPDFLRQLLQSTKNRAIVVLDEAYAEFCDQPSATTLISEFENLVVLRTLSKAWASAGLRCGVVLAQPAVIDLLRRVIAPYPLPSPVVELALRMLEKPVLEKQKQSLVRLKNNKQYLLESLRGLAFINEIIPGEANFVLIRVQNPDDILTFCANHGIIIRGFPADPLLADCIRISIGSESDLAALLKVFDEWENRK